MTFDWGSDRCVDWGGVYCKDLEIKNIDWGIVFLTGVATDVSTGVVFIVRIWK